MKTPEELAEEYTRDWWGSLPEAEGMRKAAKENFLAGYKAAQDQLADTDKMMDFNKGNFAKMEKVNMKFAYDSFLVTDEQVQDIKQIGENFSLLTDILTQLVPNGRYLSIVQTKLEEACMFAVKGITHQAGDYGNLQNKA